MGCITLLLSPLIMKLKVEQSCLFLKFIIRLLSILMEIPLFLYTPLIQSSK